MSKLEIDIRRQKKPKQVEPTDPGLSDVWPTMLEGEEEGIKPVVLRFFDAYTKKVDNAWEDLDCTTPVEELLTIFTDAQEGKRPFYFSPRSAGEINIWGSESSKVPASLISTEFVATNDKRWERKPFGNRPKEWRYSGNRWNIGGTYMYTDPTTGESKIASDYNMFNIKVELKSSKDAEPIAKIDPDMYHEEKAVKLKLKNPHHLNTIQPLVYKGNIGARKLGIKVSENSNSWAHYITSGGKYSFGFLSGVYYCPFDTTDTTNFKITLLPSFAADATATDGRIASAGPVDVFMVPRRIGYMLRYTHITKDSTTETTSALTGVTSAAATGMYKYNGFDDQISKVTVSGSAPNITIKAYTFKSKHCVGFFWGRIPCNFSTFWPNIETVLGEVSLIKFFTTTGTTLYDVDHVWCPVNTTYKQIFLDGGGSAVDAVDIYSGGNGGDFHIHSDSTNGKIKLAVSGANVYASIDQIKTTAICSCVDTPASLSYQYYGTMPNPTSSNWGLWKIWDYIEDSDLWTDIINPLREAAIALDGACSSSRVSCIPYGFGVSPSKTGDLVGIVKKGEKAFFIWRKTDEVFTEKDISYDLGAATKNYCGFESRKETGELEHFSEGGYKYTFVSGGTTYTEEDYLYDADYCDQFVLSGTGRKIVGIGRTLTLEVTYDDYANDTKFRQYISVSTDPAQITLDAPIYLMASKERAIDSIAWEEAIRGSTGQHVGANYNLRYRVARSNEPTDEDFDLRNSF